MRIFFSILLFYIIKLNAVFIEEEDRSLAASILPGEESFCNAAGSSYSYSETIDLKKGIRRISSNNCPNHYSVCQLSQCGDDRLNLAKPISYSYDIPLYPSFATDGTMIDVTCLYDPIGMALNGILFMGMADAKVESKCVTKEYNIKNYPNTGIASLKPCNINGIADGVKYCGNSMLAHGHKYDKCSGHTVLPESRYHYHTLPVCLYQQLTALAEKNKVDTTQTIDGIQYNVMLENKHSVQIGWALDGFPIYGPLGPKGIVMKPCNDGSSGSSGSGGNSFCLDACNGYKGELPEVDAYKYRYYTSGPIPTGECSNVTKNALGSCGRVENKCCVSELPDATASPYMPACFRGCRLGDDACRYTGEEGVTPFFMPTKVADGPDGIWWGLPQATATTTTTTTTDTSTSSTTEMSSSSSSISSIVSNDLPDSRYKSSLAFRFGHNRSLALWHASSDTGGERMEILPQGNSDKFLVGMTLFQPQTSSLLNESTIFYSTQSEIMSVSADIKSSSTSPTTLLRSMLAVVVNGYNFGISSAVVSVKVSDHECTSVTIISEHKVQCVVLTLPNPNIVTAEDVLIKVGLSEAKGPVLNPTVYVYNKQPVIASVNLTIKSFTPYGVTTTPPASPNAWLYWSNVGNGDSSTSGAIYRNKLDGSQLEHVLAGVQQATSLSVYRLNSDPMNDYIFFADAQTASVNFVVKSTTAETIISHNGPAYASTAYTVLVGAIGVVSITIDKYPPEGKKPQLLVTLRDGEVLSLDIEASIHHAITSNNKNATDGFGTSQITRSSTLLSAANCSLPESQWPKSLHRLASETSGSRLAGVTTIPGSSPHTSSSSYPSWSLQRIFYTDLNFQRIVAIPESTHPSVKMEVGRDFGASNLVWPYAIEAVWTADADLPIDLDSFKHQNKVVTLFVSEFLGRIWRFDLVLEHDTGLLDMSQYRLRKPTLIVDQSEYGASRLLRSRIGAAVSTGVVHPEVFFEAYA